MKQTILVTGGSGYIGSHTVLELIQHNYNVIVIDKECSVQINSPHVIYFQCDIADTAIIKTICTTYTISAVVHCAAFIQVGESVIYPEKYYDNNVSKTIKFIETIRRCGISSFIFSSSAAVYGIPQALPLTEEHPCSPISPYGRTKLIIEQTLQDYHTAYGMSVLSLRYFNASGTYPDYQLGEYHQPETHLIPCLIQALLEGRTLTVFGNDYHTEDGTCVRDYIHVRDIAAAHRKAIAYSQQNSVASSLNIATAKGLSVLDIVRTIEEVTGKKITISYGNRRPGDPDYLIADNSKARTLLAWEPEHSDKKTIIASAYQSLMHQALQSRGARRGRITQPLLS